MGYYTGKTIAFSHKGGFWKTRYSYTPTCYAAVDNVMISNNKPAPNEDGIVVDYTNSDIFWQHETNTDYNTFNGKLFPSELTVVSNQDPSAVKIFKSISLESSSNLWTGTTQTHVHPSGSSAKANEYQESPLSGFVTKEGNQYTSILPSSSNSSSHIDYVCQIDSIAEDGFVSYDWATPDAGMGDFMIPIGFNTGWRTNVLVSPPNTSILGGRNSLAVFVNTANEASVLEYISTSLNVGEWSFVPFTAWDGVTENRVYIHSYNSDGTIVFAINTTSIQIQTLSDLADFIDDLQLEFTGEDELVPNPLYALWNTIQLYSASSPAINGDPMRGQYLFLNLVNESPEAIETYAINVDFENTKLDGSKPAVKKQTKQKAPPRSK
jgi:hypothetical protein